MKITTFLTTAVVAAYALPAAANSDCTRMTSSQFSSLRKGMTEDEVKKITGCDGVRVTVRESNTTVGEMALEFYAPFINMSCAEDFILVFHDDKVVRMYDLVHHDHCGEF